MRVGLVRVNLEEILTDQLALINQRNPTHDEVCRGQNKHGLKKIKHALLSSQETITLPVQAPESCDSRLLFRGRLLRCVFTLSGVPFPVESAVSVFLIGVKVPLCFFRLSRFRLVA